MWGSVLRCGGLSGRLRSGGLRARRSLRGCPTSKLPAFVFRTTQINADWNQMRPTIGRIVDALKPLSVFSSIISLVLALSLVPGAVAQPAPAASIEQIDRAASAARDANRMDEAIRLYRSGLAANPRWTEGWWYLGATLYETGRHAEARDVFRKSIALAPENGPAWAFLGLCEFETGEYEAALQSLSKGVKLGTGGDVQFDAVVRTQLAALLNRASAFESAMEQLVAVARNGVKSAAITSVYGLGALRMPLLPPEVPAAKLPVVNLAGEAAWALGAQQPEETKRLFEELAARYPNEPGVHYAYGFYLLAVDPVAALAEFAKELEHSPSHVYARLQIVFLELKRGNADAALQRAQEAVRLAPANFMAQNAAGRAWLAMGNTGEALNALQKAVKLAPDVAQTHFYLEQVYRLVGRLEDARRAHAEFARLLLAQDPLSSPHAAPRASP